MFTRSFKVRLDEKAFFPGDAVTGTITSTRNDYLRRRRVEINFYGEAETYRKAEKKKCHRVRAAETILKETAIITAEETDEKDFILTFSFQLPSEAPPTFSGALGKIHYYLTVSVDNSVLKVVRKEVTVGSRFVISEDRLSKNQDGGGEVRKKKMRLMASSDASGYSIGDTIHVTAAFENGSPDSISTRIHGKLVRRIVYLGRRRSLQHADHTHSILSHVESELQVAPRAVQRYEFAFEVPPTWHTLRHFSLIRVDYFVKIRAGQLRVFVPVDIGVRAGAPPNGELAAIRREKESACMIHPLTRRLFLRRLASRLVPRHKSLVVLPPLREHEHK